MDRVCRFIGISNSTYQTNDIIEIQPGGDHRMPNHTDEEWEAYKSYNLDTLKQNALGMVIDGKNLTEAEIQVKWEDGETLAEDFRLQRTVFIKSLETYVEKRNGEYPDWKTQLDKIYHEGIDAWKTDMIKPIKDKYPKE